MAYCRKRVRDKETVMCAEHYNNLQDGIDYFYGAIYDYVMHNNTVTYTCDGDKSYYVSGIISAIHYIALDGNDNMIGEYLESYTDNNGNGLALDRHRLNTDKYECDKCIVKVTVDTMDEFMLTGDDVFEIVRKLAKEIEESLIDSIPKISYGTALPESATDGDIFLLIIPE